MNKKGFLLAVSSTLLFLSIFLIAVFFAAHINPISIHEEKTRNIYDDVLSDVEEILKLSASVNYTGSDVVFVFTDQLPLNGGNTVMGDYRSFIEDTYSAALNSNISLGYPTAPSFQMRPHALFYEYSDYNKSEVRVYNLSGDAIGVKSYAVELDFNESLVNMTEDTVSGDLDVTLNASFVNASYDFSGSIGRDGNSTWVFNMPDSTFTLRIGNNIIRSLDKDSSMVAGCSGVFLANMETEIKVDDNRTGGVRSNFILNITSTAVSASRDEIRRNTYMWFTPPTSIPIPTVISTCNEYCLTLGYVGGACVQNPGACSQSGGTSESGGNKYCQPGACCCYLG